MTTSSYEIDGWTEGIMINIRDTTGYRMYLYGVFAVIPTRTPEYFVDLKKFHRLAECVTNKANIVRCLSRALTHRIYIHTWSTEYSVSNVHWNMSHSADTSACSIGFVFFFRCFFFVLRFLCFSTTLPTKLLMVYLNAYPTGHDIQIPS